MQRYLRAIAIAATLGSISSSYHLPAFGQATHQMHSYPNPNMSSMGGMEHKNMGSMGTPPGKFHFLSDNEHAALRFYNQGLDKLADKDYEGAIASFTQVLRLTPQYDMAYFNRANAQKQLGKYQAAIDDYSKALETNPTFTYLYYYRGNLREKLGDIKGAIADYNQAIASYPEEGTGYSNRGFARYKLGDIQGAMEDLQAAITVNPGNAGAYFNRATIYANLGKHSKAIADYQKAKSLYLEQGNKSEYLKTTLAIAAL